MPPYKSKRKKWPKFLPNSLTYVAWLTYDVLGPVVDAGGAGAVVGAGAAESPVGAARVGAVGLALGRLSVRKSELVSAAPVSSNAAGHERRHWNGTSDQTNILNFTLGPQGCTWPPAVKFVPLWECSPLEGVNTLYCLEEWRGEQRISAPGENFTPRWQKFTPGGQLRPWGHNLPLVKNGPKGCQIFLGATYQNGGNVPDDHKTCQYLPLQDPSKFTQIGNLGLKMYHLATLVHLPTGFPDL
jgi:hypothetical protein